MRLISLVAMLLLASCTSAPQLSSTGPLFKLVPLEGTKCEILTNGEGKPIVWRGKSYGRTDSSWSCPKTLANGVEFAVSDDVVVRAKSAQFKWKVGVLTIIKGPTPGSVASTWWAS